jgi:hypothetical protein
MALGGSGKHAIERLKCQVGMWEPADCTLTFQAHHTLLLGSGHVGLRNLGNTVRAIFLFFLSKRNAKWCFGWEEPVDLGKECGKSTKALLRLGLER